LTIENPWIRSIALNSLSRILSHIFVPFLVFFSFSAKATILYDLHYLPSPDYLNANVLAEGINNHGLIVGSGNHFNGDERALLWGLDRKVRDISSHGTNGKMRSAVDISDNGIIVGRGTGPTGSSTTALWWSETTGLQVVGANTVLMRTNSNGVTAGTAGLTATLWDKNNGLQSLGLPRHSQATDVNNHMFVVGSNANRDAYMFASSTNEYTTITSEGAIATGIAINNSNIVAGRYNGQQGYVSFVWSQGGGLQVIDDWQSGILNVGPADINDYNEVVGKAKNPNDNSEIAVMWDEKNGLRYLQDLVDPTLLEGDLKAATAINDAGQIVGYGWRGGTIGAFVLDPVVARQAVSEPSSFLLAIAGLASVLAAFSRKKTAQVQ
jgi:hypothetical protein